MRPRTSRWRRCSPAPWSRNTACRTSSGRSPTATTRKRCSSATRSRGRRISPTRPRPSSMRRSIASSMSSYETARKIIDENIDDLHIDRARAARIRDAVRRRDQGPAQGQASGARIRGRYLAAPGAGLCRSDRRPRQEGAARARYRRHGASAHDLRSADITTRMEWPGSSRPFSFAGASRHERCIVLRQAAWRTRSSISGPSGFSTATRRQRLSPKVLRCPWPAAPSPSPPQS